MYYSHVKSFFQKDQTLHNFWILRVTLPLTMSEYNSSPEEEIKYLKITKKNNTLSIFSWESYSNKKKKIQRAVGRFINFFSERNLKQCVTQCDVFLL